VSRQKHTPGSAAPAPAPVGTNSTPTAVRTEYQAVQAVYSGPIPPPEDLFRYNDAFPGCAERIVQMAERQSQHRQELERRVVESNTRRQRDGQWMAFVLSLVVIGVGTWLLLEGKDVLGIAAILGALGTLVGVFVYARESQKTERREKRVPFENPAPPGRAE